MKKTTLLVSAMLLLLPKLSAANNPPGFTWVNLERDKATMTVVRQALHDDSITAIREVGVKDTFALVMTASRESDAPVDYDRWSIYNISLTTGKSRLLVVGYGVKLLDWTGPEKDELGITYLDCLECESATFFTTLYFEKDAGWQSRWHNATEDPGSPQPGAAALITDDDEAGVEIEQVFAVVPQAKDSFAVGTWVRTHDSRWGTIDDDVERYSIDPATNKDRMEKLQGDAALAWERKICANFDTTPPPSTGQDSAACKSALTTATPQHATPQ